MQFFLSISKVCFRGNNSCSFFYQFPKSVLGGIIHAVFCQFPKSVLGEQFMQFFVNFQSQF